MKQARCDRVSDVVQRMARLEYTGRKNSEDEAERRWRGDAIR